MNARAKRGVRPAHGRVFNWKNVARLLHNAGVEVDASTRPSYLDAGRLDSRDKCSRPSAEGIPNAVERMVDDQIFQMAQDLGCAPTLAGTLAACPASPLFLAGCCTLCAIRASSKASASSTDPPP
jgi:hypothetical protein